MHPIQIAKWRKAAIERMPDLFADGRSHIKRRDSEPDREALFGEIGRLKVELDWLKKKPARSTEDLRALVDRDHPNLSVRRQCELLGINRTGLYYEPTGESEENLPLMRLLDEQYTRTPFYGSRRMAAWLSSRLMRLMEIEAVYPKPRLSEPGEGHRIYPYLLRGYGGKSEPGLEHGYHVHRDEMGIRVCGDGDGLVQSIRAELVAALKGALRRGKPEIFNSDQGSQFTSERFTGELAAREIAISMDGRGRCMDNIFIERLWRSLNYEEVYLKDYETEEARAGIGRYFRLYNEERLHQSREYRTPGSVYRERS